MPPRKALPGGVAVPATASGPVRGQIGPVRPLDEHRAWTGWRLAASSGALAIGYGALLVVSYLAANLPQAVGTVWWAPAGLAVGVLALAPRRAWGALGAAVALASLVLGVVGVPPERTLPLGIDAIWAFSNALSALAGAAVFVRLGEPPLDLRSVRNVVALVGPSAFASAAVATAGSWLGAVAEPLPGLRFSVWFSMCSVALGQVSIAPLVLAVGGERGRWSPGRAGEAVLLSGLLLLTAWAAFVLPSPGAQIVALASATFPLLAWAAVRFGPRGAAWTSFVLTVVATWRTRLGEGPFGGALPSVEGLSYVAVFFVLATVSALLLAAVASERRASDRAATVLQAEVSAQTLRNVQTLALLQAVLESAPVGIAIIDPELRVVRANATLALLDGVPLEAHAGRAVRELVPDVAPLVEEKVREVVATGEPVVGFRLERAPAEGAAGPVIWECTWFPIRTPDGRSVGVCAMIADVSWRVGAEREREHALQQAREAIALRDQFLQVASHELKTPLTPLSARLAMLERRAAAGDRIEPEAIARVRVSLRRLIALVDELLDVTHIREPGWFQRRERCSLRALVEEVAAPFRKRSRVHRLVLELPAEELRLACDRENLERVIENLLDNAFKYSPGGGTVRVRLVREGDEAVLSVTDEGIGIPPEEQAALFTRYARATNAPARSYGGLGLGLYLSREIVERHGGQISVASEVGRGSTFTVRLPLEGEPPAG